MKPQARPFHRAAMDAFEHARQHADMSDSVDTAQVVLSVDYGLEMLLKAVLLERGESIMAGSGNRSIALPDALRRAGTYNNSSAAEVLRVRRDSLQHFAQYSDSETTRDLFEGALLLVSEVLRQDFDLALPNELRARVAPRLISDADGLMLLEPSEHAQRDISAGGDLVAWAQGVPDSSALAVRVKIGGRPSVQLTPDDEFEYMPRVGPNSVAAYRQSGGVVLYDLANGSRELISDSGAPTCVTADWVVTQGRGIPDGLGGGIHLFNRRTRQWERIADGGDTGRIAQDRVIWQELSGERLDIRGRELGGGPITTLAENATYPAPDATLLAWTDWVATQPRVYIATLDGKRCFEAGPGMFPSLLGTLIAYLEPRDGGHQLLVIDWVANRELVRLPWVGFPASNGPVLVPGAVYFESATGRSTHAVWKLRLPAADGAK